MTTRLVAIVTAVVAGMAASAGRAAQTPISQPFRARTDVVLVDVTVLNGGAPVSGLGVADFELRDNGVKQTIDAVSVETLPLDLSLLIDASGSVRAVADQFKSDVGSLSRTLRADDRFRLVTFASNIELTVPLQPAGAPIRFNATSLQTAGGTAVNDALLYALVQPTPAGRRQMIVMFTDGMDSFSWLSSQRLPVIAQHADAILNVVIAGRDPKLERLIGDIKRINESLSASGIQPLTSLESALSLDPFVDAAQATGGKVYDAKASRNLIAALERMLDVFRNSYLLAYTPNKGAAGWHELTVKVPKSKKYEVRARKGYDAGGR